MEINIKDCKLEINEAENQFEFDINGKTALIEYAIEGMKIYLTHTEVPSEFEGHGIASELVRQTLQHIKTQNLTVMPLCSFVAHYIDNHAEWHSLLSEGYQM
ncbi:N-acetyltransferase [Flavobacterium noncentrifugens]|uniref:N-acetyltransferase domain-containing protein n=1 Tax=Flavobacterium noncentrifugens TaxID=1128970 RepID=A0A1G8RXN5_9FLAO|nr:GNAT family N-acetyltransferase [Flavobacterium noncentrifugens]GEP49624.1 N-acetyltransferase [Flavobacterium noncentrifugens]SDJ21738.1 hypothetical protein SAMN04487935_0328 [Flavobacterium noncentrifugens]